ncbi:PadR family transcriptional regulator [Microbacterium sp. ASV81]|uniref:Helix-turn-helix transcriptional regulator n=1 Tax=Microbacterium capsulatum TaxID=3041921 RepID=A0ABU0XCV1_9MICO|nr:helix-turn-helix transcriptional regulator [Microbacterium sp. ASV81]MDQ4212782.1 helix-turn-helix transcriptional regulator [Microbacterium sp. ASV81]
MNAESLKGHLELLVLAIVSAGPVHGYGVIDALRERSDGSFDLAEGTVYPVLHRLERAGLLQHEWSEASGRRRKLYSLTAAGSARLTEQRRGWSDFVKAVESVIDQGRQQWQPAMA